MKQILFAAIAVATAFDTVADWLPRQDRVPGGVAWVNLGVAEDPAPRAFLGADRVMVVRQANAWLAVVGLPLTLATGEHELNVIDASERRRSLRFSVRPKTYGAQRITLKDKRMVDPTAEDLQRIGRDTEAIAQIFMRWTERETPLLTFEVPAHGRLSGVFGTRRFFNDQERQPHNGIDIAAARGTQVLAPADGVVAGVGDYFFNGLTLFIDHGRGLVSMYNHLDQVTVTPGAAVTRGQRIADIGMSGRVTGPHLHWAVSLNNTRVDPLLFVSEQSRKHLAQQK